MVEPQKQVTEGGKVEYYGPVIVAFAFAGVEVNEDRPEKGEVDHDDAADLDQSGLGHPCPG